ncbi:MAG: hypothetical protein PF485_12160 [Bacteroidales bacterium]|jgi:hypothetical protein|nr:hypothetical protein [Bacteroidales bacterium]
MKFNYFKILLIIIGINSQTACGQINEKEKFSFDFTLNAENLYASTDKTYEGLVMGFSIYNKDNKIGKGGGWLIYKDGSVSAKDLANKLYPNEKRPGRYLVDDLFNKDSVNRMVDSSMLRDFDIYIYIIDNKYLELKQNIDGEGAGRTYSYYETYPLDIMIYKRVAGENYFIKYKSYHIANEEEKTGWLNSYLDLIALTVKERNLK